MDNEQRIALVETQTQGVDALPKPLIRYQFGNHLGSASVEVDEQARIISYEEYYPYGSTSYQAAGNRTEMPKRYRYTGKERDGETGFNYHKARYYSPWLGRWLTCDRLDEPFNRPQSSQYIYAANNPMVLLDHTGLKPESDDRLMRLVQDFITKKKTLGLSTSGAQSQRQSTKVHSQAIHQLPQIEKKPPLSDWKLAELEAFRSQKRSYLRVHRRRLRAAGPFSSTVEAAFHFGRTYNPMSTHLARELGTNIYKRGASYYYDKPTMGRRDRVRPVWSGTGKWAGDIHTHGAAPPDDPLAYEDFSTRSRIGGDILSYRSLYSYCNRVPAACEMSQRMFFLVTPNYRLKVFEQLRQAGVPEFARKWKISHVGKIPRPMVRVPSKRRVLEEVLRRKLRTLETSKSNVPYVSPLPFKGALPLPKRNGVWS